MSASVSIDAISEGGAVSSIAKRVMALMFLVTMVDSYDQVTLSFATPALVAEWGIEKAAMGPVFSVQLLGLLIGGITFGMLGDKIGRKLAIILGMLLFGVLSLATMVASSVDELLVIRFFVGVGVGGVLPNAVALSNEFAPRRFRVTAVSVMYVGYVCGGIGSGIVSAWLLPRYGWEIIFLLGGIVPLILAGILVFALPESIQYLAASDKKARQQEATRLAALMRPDLEIAAGTRIVNEVRGGEKLALRELFAGPLRSMTVLLWLMYIANSTTAFALLSWMPSLIEDLGFNPKAAALATSLMFVGAALGGVAAARLTDRVGLGPIILMPAVAIPFMAGLGFLGGAPLTSLHLISFFIGFFMAGFQNNLHGISASIYPTRVRAMGVGWALGAGRLGGMAGPFIIGMMMTRGASPQILCIALSIPLLVSVAAVALLRGAYQVNVCGQTTGGRVPLESQA
ncbi:MAG: transporter [Alphaproteobacteria bacterium]|nr:transporter [Alphaproteobacteria bacterium]